MRRNLTAKDHKLAVIRERLQPLSCGTGKNHLRGTHENGRVVQSKTATSYTLIADRRRATALTIRRPSSGVNTTCARDGHGRPWLGWPDFRPSKRWTTTTSVLPRGRRGNVCWSFPAWHSCTARRTSSSSGQAGQERRTWPSLWAIWPSSAASRSAHVCGGSDASSGERTTAGALQ